MGNIKGNTVLTYDVNSKHVEVKDALKAKGYMATVSLNNTSYVLPSTTVWMQNGTTSQAITDIKAVCNSLGVKLQYAVSVIATDWEAYKSPS
jgi:hypothetical protein